MPLPNLTLSAGLLYMHKYEITAGPEEGAELPFTGDYTLLLEGAYDDTTPGSYRFVLQQQTTGSPVAMATGETVSGAIDAAGETDVFVFTLSENAQLYFDSLTDDAQIIWSLEGPAGLEVEGRPFSDSDGPAVPVPTRLPVSRQESRHYGVLRMAAPTRRYWPCWMRLET